MTKPLILAAAALALAGCADEPAETADPIGADTPVLDGPAEVVTQPTDDAVVLEPDVADAPDMTEGEVLTDDAALTDDMTEGEVVTDDL